MSAARAVALVASFFALITLTGCTAINYVAQAAGGQLEIRLKARDLDDVLRDEKTHPRVRELLAEVPRIKKFGERHGLKPTGNYVEYVALDRPAAVFVVSACDPLSFKSKKWSFPIVGSVPYLGWFDREDARFFANELRDEGWDVDLRGASAYSTLGWFKDPILSTMLSAGDDGVGDLANTVLHESFHATLYVEGQTHFNESVANYVGDRLAEVYLDERFGPGSAEKTAYVESMVEGERRAKVLHDAYVRLDALYSSPRSKEEKLAEKRRLLAALRAELGFRRPINNATLMGSRFYNTGREQLDALLSVCGGSFPRMIQALRGIGPKSFAAPQEEEVEKVIEPLVRAGCAKGG